MTSYFNWFKQKALKGCLCISDSEMQELQDILDTTDVKWVKWAVFIIIIINLPIKLHSNMLPVTNCSHWTCCHISLQRHRASLSRQGFLRMLESEDYSSLKWKCKCTHFIWLFFTNCLFANLKAGKIHGDNFQRSYSGVKICLSLPDFLFLNVCHT